MRVVGLVLFGLFGCDVSKSLEPTTMVDAPPPIASCDLDNDGACDEQTWRCGAPPNSPGEDPFFGQAFVESVYSHDVSLAGRGRFVVGAAGKQIQLAFRYDWVVDCPSGPCQAQIEIGLVSPATNQQIGCIVDRQMGDRQVEWDDPGMATFAVPAVSGIYDVRLAIAKQPACGTAWTPPEENHTIAKICVP